MTAEYLYGQSRLASRTRSPRVAPSVERRAVPASGRIIALLVGQGTGFIRLGTDGKVFFHRADVQPGTSINDFELGDAVEFDLVEDPVSGARAIRVRRTALG
jgi:cold shock CspA family protein